MKIGNREFNCENQTYVMGILNVTPDSFSDGGSHEDVETAVAKAIEMERDGAAIIDLGGESTRPGHTVISAETEIARIVPVLKALKKSVSVPISVDTYKYEVAKAAAENGADLINDIYGFQRDSRVADLCAEYALPCCLMHNRTDQNYGNFLEDVRNDLETSIEIALKAGVSEEKIILDPGIGFAKNRQQDLLMLKQLGWIQSMGYPILLGASRKRIVGEILNLPVGEREEGTMAISIWASHKRCMFVRVHDVRSNYRALKMADILFREQEAAWIE